MALSLALFLALFLAATCIALPAASAVRPLEMGVIQMTVEKSKKPFISPRGVFIQVSFPPPLAWETVRCQY